MGERLNLVDEMLDDDYYRDLLVLKRKFHDNFESYSSKLKTLIESGQKTGFAGEKANLLAFYKSFIAFLPEFEKEFFSQIRDSQEKSFEKKLKDSSLKQEAFFLSVLTLFKKECDLNIATRFESYKESSKEEIKEDLMEEVDDFVDDRFRSFKDFLKDRLFNYSLFAFVLIVMFILHFSK